MAEKLVLRGCPDRNSGYYEKPDHLRSLMIGVPLKGKQVRPGGNPVSYVYIPLDVTLPKAKGTYQVDKPGSPAKSILWDERWIGYLNSVRGDHHTPNPCGHSWLGGTLTWEGYSLPNSFPYHAQGSAIFYPNWDGTGQVPAAQKLPLVKDGPSYYYENTLFIGGKQVSQTHYPVKSGVSAREFDGVNGCIGWMNSGAMRSIENPNLYGPNFAWISADNRSVRMTLKSWNSSANTFFHPDYFYFWEEWACTVTVESVTVRANMTGSAKVTFAFTESGWQAETGYGPGHPDVAFQNSWTSTENVEIVASSDCDRYPQGQAGIALIGAAEAWAGIQWRSLDDRSFVLQEVSENQRTESISEALRNQDALESNWLENASGFGNPIELLYPFAECIGAFRSKDYLGVCKSIAAAYLEWKYVIAPDVADYNDVKSNALRLFKAHAKNNGGSRVKQVGSVSVINNDPSEPSRSARWTTIINMRHNDGPFEQLWSALCAFGVEPSLTNLWDLVPYSFVVDWFVPVGKFLDEAYSIVGMQLSYHDIVRSEQFTDETDLDCDLADFEGTLKYRYFERFVGQGIPKLDPYRLATSLDPHLSASQLMQGGALIVQRIH